MKTTKNLDLPEASFDALVQSVACEQQLGWRSRTAEGPDRGLQRLVLLVTDDQPHLAGDGRVCYCVCKVVLKMTRVLSLISFTTSLPLFLHLFSLQAYIRPMMENVA